MIVKMKFLSITGPKDDIERMARRYLSKYEIQLENALTELRTVKNLRPYMEGNPYEESLRSGREYLPAKGLPSEVKNEEMMPREAEEVIQKVGERICLLQEQKTALTEERKQYALNMEKIEPFQQLPYDTHKILNFHYVKFRFGRIPREYYEKFEKYVYGNLNTIFYITHSNQDYVWGVYFMPASLSSQIDAVYASMHFEVIFIPDEYEGTAQEACNRLHEKLKEIDGKIGEIDKAIQDEVAGNLQELYDAVNCLEEVERNFGIRKYAALTRERNHTFYILCGWMTQKDADAFQKEILNDEKTFVVVEDDHDNVFSTPPTKLKNPKLFRPFEMYIKMYGLPSYNEMDPTMFVALSYAFIFGAMFGDVGQGLVLLLGGFALYRMKGMALAAIISCAGVFSTIFGFLYGSFFGFEDTVIHHIWLRPKEAMTTLPVVGQMNTVFVVAVVFGMFLILLAMIFHIMVSLKNKNAEEAFLDTNGVAGLIFYGALVAIIFLVMTGHPLPAGAILAVVLGIPLLCMALKEPICAWFDKRAKLVEGGVVMYVVQTFFEMFEVLLSFFSNTLSFVRIGAFAVSHAAMMEVVLMLAGFENAGGGNWIVVVLGNVFVCAMEGLIVGIQVLRLEYYELFSRFYKGTGREFKPYQLKKKES
ncbi:MAG: ATPase [Lachnospiraceae bacterium]|nr:ATPase [Lachnospiraceae bacterium]MCI8996822.1 ATPase [Lachnospiraceae bacterium]MCI9135163.1 ATPase [Lachnospiraceae bacterium]